MPTQSPLELFHPRGHVAHALLLGSNCAPIFRPLPEAERGIPADLIIVAPSVSECLRPGWTAESCSSIAEHMTEDGIVYMLVPPPWRWFALYRLRSLGLRQVSPVVHLPDPQFPSLVAPLSASSLRFALHLLPWLATWKRRLVDVMIRGPRGAHLFALCVPHAAFVVQRPGSLPPWNWLFTLLSGQSTAGDVVLRTGWRGPDAPSILYPLVYGETAPAVVAKVRPIGQTSEEADKLRSLGPAARQAGAAVPEPLAMGRVGQRTVLVERAISGQPVAEILAADPSRLEEILRLLTDWLSRWNVLTKRMVIVSDALLEREILVPARRLAPFVPHSEEYIAYLLDLCRSVNGCQVPVVDCHNDLTMWNVMLDSRGDLGVLDWEAGESGDLPLTDLFYATVDAVGASLQCGDQPAAYEQCFGAGAANGMLARHLEDRLEDALHIAEGWRAVCFHACWLRHAMHELDAERAVLERPFRDIVRSLSLRIAAGHYPSL